MNSFVASRLAVFVVVAFALVGAVSERSARAQVGSVTDSVAAAVTPDSAGADSDTTDNALANLSRDVQDVGRDIVSGNFTQLKRRFQALIGSIAVDFFPRMIGALVVLLVSLVVYWLVKVILGRTLKHSRAVDAGLEHILMRTYRIVVLTFIAGLVLSQFGVNVAALLAGLSVVGIAVGFAAQDTVQNYIAGITILIDKPFSVGDNVEINGVFGSVNKITLRSTRVRTQNGELSIVAFNAHEERVVYHTQRETRIDFKELGEAVQASLSGMVNIDQLQDKQSGEKFLKSLFEQNLTRQGVAESDDPEPPDAIVFLGPKVVFERPASSSVLADSARLQRPLFYFMYNRNPRSYPWKDAVSAGLRNFDMKEFDITSAKDFGRAVQEWVQMLSKLREQGS